MWLRVETPESAVNELIMRSKYRMVKSWTEGRETLTHFVLKHIFAEEDRRTAVF